MPPGLEDDEAPADAAPDFDWAAAAAAICKAAAVRLLAPVADCRGRGVIEMLGCCDLEPDDDFVEVGVCGGWRDGDGMSMDVQLVDVFM